jgi:hypothetical protein
MRRGLAWLVALSTVSVLAAAVAAPVSAHPDPAGEFLTTQRVFISYDAHLSAALKQRLESAVASAASQGFAIRVALIWRRSDLGKVPKYWQRPGAYAAFMYGENAYYFKGARLLVAMPDGFGFAWNGHSTAQAYRTLSRIRLEGGASQLAEATTAAVQRLAAADGVHVTTSVTASPDNRDRVKILIGVGILLLAGFLFRRRLPGRLPVQGP